MTKKLSTFKNNLELMYHNAGGASGLWLGLPTMNRHNWWCNANASECY